jgi:hypothetical protein
MRAEARVPDDHEPMRCSLGRYSRNCVHCQRGVRLWRLLCSLGMRVGAVDSDRVRPDQRRFGLLCSWRDLRLQPTGRINGPDIWI